MAAAGPTVSGYPSPGGGMPYSNPELLAETETGDTLASKDRQLKLPPLDFPEPT